jgi:hypothetical protein
MFGHVKRGGEGRVLLGTLSKFGASLVLVLGISIIRTGIKLIEGWHYFKSLVPMRLVLAEG